MEDVTAEYAADEIAPAPELRVRPRVTVAAKTDLGRVRENNEDKFEFLLPEDDRTLASKGLMFLVCDGMGGHAAGQIASELTSKTFLDVYAAHSAADPAEAMEAGVRAANRYVLDNAASHPGRRGMGTTLSALVLIQDAAYTVQVGDSRVYRLRDGALERLTRDHTYMEEMVRSGALTEEQAATHPHRHILTRAVGVEDRVVPDVERHDSRPGDLYVLCSDGLTNHVTDDAIREAVTHLAPGFACWRLIGQAMLDGGSDNCTVLIARVDGLEDLRPEKE